MLLTLLLVTFLISVLVSSLVVWIFTRPIDRILNFFIVALIAFVVVRIFELRKAKV